MKTILTYKHTRNLFTKNEFKPFIKKYFKNVKFLGTESGNWDAKISISNWDEMKNTLPKYAIPESVAPENNEKVTGGVYRNNGCGRIYINRHSK